MHHAQTGRRYAHFGTDGSDDLYRTTKRQHGRRFATRTRGPASRKHAQVSNGRTLASSADRRRGLICPLRRRVGYCRMVCSKLYRGESVRPSAAIVTGEACLCLSLDLYQQYRWQCEWETGLLEHLKGGGQARGHQQGHEGGCDAR